MTVYAAVLLAFLCGCVGFVLGILADRECRRQERKIRGVAD